MRKPDRSYRPQFYVGIAAGLLGLICLAIGVSNHVRAITTIGAIALAIAAVSFIAALWGYLAKNRA